MPEKVSGTSSKSIICDSRYFVPLKLAYEKKKSSAEPGPEIATSPFFNSDEGEARKLLYDLICQREVDLWKETKAQQVLTAAAQSIVALQLPASKNKFNKEWVKHRSVSLFYSEIVIKHQT